MPVGGLTFLVAFVGALLWVLKREYPEWGDRAATALVRAAARSLSPEERADREEEWLSEVDAIQQEKEGCTGLIFALGVAVRFIGGHAAEFLFRPDDFLNYCAIAAMSAEGDRQVLQFALLIYAVNRTVVGGWPILVSLGSLVILRRWRSPRWFEPEPIFFTSRRMAWVGLGLSSVVFTAILVTSIVKLSIVGTAASLTLLYRTGMWSRYLWEPRFMGWRRAS